MKVEIEHVSKRYGTQSILDDVSLSIREHEFLALVGPSGSGKTTLLRIIAGLMREEAGCIAIGDRDMAKVPARARRIGFVFQNYALFRHMTVAENVAFGLRVRSRATRPTRQEIRVRVRELLALVQIAELATRFPGQLSGGQRQRVALARALAIEPSVLLLDEPFGALDPLVRKSLRRSLRQLHDTLGLTSILVTHDQDEAVELADRVAVMRSGKILQVDTAAGLEESPADAFVFGFMGESVSLQGRVESGWFLPDETGFPQIATTQPAGRAEAMIRPHHMTLRPGDGPAQIVGVSVQGPLVRYTVSLNGRQFPIVAAERETAFLPVGARCDVGARQASVFGTQPSDGSWAADRQSYPGHRPREEHRALSSTLNSRSPI